MSIKSLKKNNWWTCQDDTCSVYRVVQLTMEHHANLVLDNDELH